MARRHASQAALVAWLAVAVGCAPAAPPRARVCMAPELAEPVRALFAAFEREHPGQQIVLEPQPAPQLLAALRDGAAADVFVAATDEHVVLLIASGNTVGLPRRFARRRAADDEVAHCSFVRLASGRAPGAAAAFIDFVLSPPGQRLLAGCGLERI